MERTTDKTKFTAPNPWIWVPTLYFAEGVPYFIVNNISVALFAQMGVPNGQMALFTSLLYLPWTLKPLWSPIVDITLTKRRWIVAMQAVVAISLILLTLTLPHPDTATIEAGNTPMSLFSFTLILFVITAFASATHDIAADGFYMLALDEHKQAAYVGLRSVFYRLSNIFCNSLLVFIAGWLETHGRSIPAAWSYTLAAAAVLFCLLTLWHSRLLPKQIKTDDEKSGDTEKESKHSLAFNFGDVFVSFFKKPHIVFALLFMLLFRLPEAFLLKMVTPFMLGTNGDGIGITLEQYSIIYGMAGVIALLAGGILGGIYASRVGLRKALWLMVAAITLPDIVYLILCIYPTHNLLYLGMAVALEQFGYGFGFTAYMLYLMYFSQGERQTSHYALCTAFMALGMMLPGAMAGYVQESLGYTLFFALVMLLCFMTVVVSKMVQPTIDPEYGKKTEQKD